MCSGVTSGAGTWPRLRRGGGLRAQLRGTRGGAAGGGAGPQDSRAGAVGVCVCVCARARVRVRADDGEQWSFLIIFKRMKTAQADSI